MVEITQGIQTVREIKKIKNFLQNNVLHSFYQVNYKVDPIMYPDYSGCQSIQYHFKTTGGLAFIQPSNFLHSAVSSGPSAKLIPFGEALTETEFF